MARFLGNVNTRLGAVSAGFSQAAVFTNPGSTSFQIPASASKVKIIAIGAGSNYRPGRYCGTSSSCWSGVSYPSCTYNFDFCGHLMGAGGGYSEKLFTGVGGRQMTIQVGSPTYNANSYFAGTNGGNCNTINIDGNYSDAVYVGASVSTPNASIPNGTTVTIITKKNTTAVANTTFNQTQIILSSAADAANVLPGSTVHGPGISSGTVVTAISSNGTVSISTATLGQVYNGTFNFNGTQLTLSNNFTSGANTIVSTVIAGPSSSSVTGLTQTITATNATEFPLLWTCTGGQSTARNSQYDNPISAGFQLPVCGYTNCYNAWYNIPGTGSGGDVNYSGGTGILAPQFVSGTNVFDTNIAGGSPTNSGGWTTPYIYCFQVTSYHTVFGVTNCCGSSFPNCYPCNCVCPFVCNCLCNFSNPTGMCHIFYGLNSGCYDSMATTSIAASGGRENTVRVRDPIGIGASSGSQAGTGNRAAIPEQVVESNWNKDGGSGYSGSGGISASSGTGSLLQYYYTQSGYDEQFGGSNYNCVCVYMYMGCVYGTVSAGSPVCGNAAATSLCYFCMGNGFTNTFGMPAPRSCACFPYSAAGSSTNSAKCMVLSYDAEKINGSQFKGYSIPTGLLSDVNGNNLSSIEYGAGASNKKAQLGGGGNRYYPAGGNGAVVVMWG